MRARESCRNDAEPAQGEKFIILSKAGRAEASKPLTSDVELQDLEFVLLGLSPALVQCFLIMTRLLPFGMVIRTLFCHV